MRKLILLIAAMCLPIIALAQQRTESEAISIARSFWGSPQAKLKAVPQMKINQAKARVAAKAPAITNNPCYYVVNDEANGRFVIVSADERLYTILGYSDNGVFAGDSIPLGLADLLIGYDNQYEFVKTNNNVTYKVSKSKSGSKIEPLIVTKWGQSSPYNNDCPRFGDAIPSYTGCVATAMAQVMNYHRYPNVGIGSTSYTSTSLGFNEQMSFSDCSFDWNNMSDMYDELSTSEQIDAVAKLMHACGVAVHMDYTFIQSGATANDMAYALHKYFGYNNNLKYYERKYFSSEEWNSIIIEDLTAGLPILYSGMGESVQDDGSTGRYGHQFILDGYDGESKYHFNWGWEGEYDGYFELTAIDPSDNDFTLDQAMVCNVAPETKGNREDIFFATSFLLNKDNVRLGEEIKATFDPICYSTHTNTYDAYFNGNFGIGVFDLDHKFVKSLYSNTGSGKFQAGVTFRDPLSPSLKFESSTFKEGCKYYIAPYAKSNEATDYTLIRTTYGQNDYYLAEVKDGEVNLSLKGIPVEDRPELKIGTLYANAFNLRNEKVKWNITLTKDSKEANKYWLNNIDPALEGAENLVYGLLDDTGTVLVIPQGQSLGENLTLTNYSDNKDIRCLVSSIDNTLTIPDIWGCMKTVNGNAETFSCYTFTEIGYVPKEEIVTVEKPTIIVEEGILQILCSTPNVNLYYTLDGTTPTDKSVKYSDPVSLDGNCIVKTVAILDGAQSSEIAEFKVTSFTTSNPVISVVDNIVTLQCATPGALIYYTLDGSDPKGQQNLYSGSFPIANSCILKAYAVKEKYNDSEVIEHSVIYTSEGEGNNSITVSDNVAGKLNERISISDIIGKSILTITGELNGTDFVHLYELLNEGNISDLDLGGTKIISGGQPYYSTSIGDTYYTETDIIGKYLFNKLKTLVSLVLPASAKKIDMFGIYECDNIGRLDLPQDCIELKMMAVSYCKNLNTLFIGRNLKTFDGDAVDGCRNLTEYIVDATNHYFIAKDGILFSKDETSLIKYPYGRTDVRYNIPSGVRELGKKAFEDAKFCEVEFPNSIQVIGSSAFQNCKNLEYIEMPNSISEIGTFAFWSCTALNSVVLSENITEIPSYAFQDCSSLREFSIGRGVRRISDEAFTNCKQLLKFDVSAENDWYCSEDGILYTKDMTTLLACPTAYYSMNLVVPEGVSLVSAHAFYGCPNIEKITLPSSLKEIGNSAFSGCKNVESIIMPSGLDRIGSMAFYGCKNIESLIIPEGMSELGMMVADGCSRLSFLSLPGTLNKIATYAFSNCESLMNIRCGIEDIHALVVEASPIDGSYNSFSNIPDDCTWHVPMGCIEAYKAQPWWVTTWNIVDDIQTGVSTISNDGNVDLEVGDGYLTVTGGDNCIVCIYNSNGILVKRIEFKDGRSETVELPNGIYFVNGNKVLVK